MRLILFCLILFHSVVASAGQRAVFLAADLGYFHYRETEHDSTLDKEYGFLPGFFCSGSFPFRGLILSGSFGFSYTGSATYDGQTQGGLPLKQGGQREIIWHVEASAGRAIELAARWGMLEFIPHAGIGYRQWIRGQSGAGDYEEKYTWFYVPVGFSLFPEDLPHSYSIGLDFSLLFPFSAHMKAYLSDVDPAMEDVSFDLPSHPGFRVRLPISYRLSKTKKVQLVPSYTYWSFGQSETNLIHIQGGYSMYAWEPESETHRFQVFLGIVLLF